MWTKHISISKYCMVPATVFVVVGYGGDTELYEHHFAPLRLC